ncbi:type VII secretion-associated protein [Rhodococcus kronopolitis]|uniref:Type VII secretion-associated protein n=1 Tax=Rhodococcus kronopolitis TaxID=1460226 RepID=A0ABV9FVT8_9NOCA
MAFGEAPRGLGPASYERHPVRYIDDRLLAVGREMLEMAEVLVGLLAHAAAGSGCAEVVDVVVLTHPANWGRLRRDSLAAAGRSVGREVVLVPLPEAVRRAVGTGDDTEVAVLDVGRLTSTLTIGGSADCIHLGEWGSADIAGRADAGPAVRGSEGDSAAPLREACQAWPPWVLVTGELSTHDRQVLRKALDSAGSPATVVRAVTGSQVVAGALALARERRPTTPPESPSPGAAEFVPPRRRWLRIGAGVSVGSALVALAAAAVVVGLSPESPHPETPSPSPSPSPPLSVPAAVGVAVPEPVERSNTGRVAVPVPPGWGERAEGRREDRLEFVRDDGAPARILVVQKELEPGADLDAVADALRRRIAQRPGIFRDFGLEESGGRELLTYREVPDPDSEVRWRVLVVDGLQVSIGCQTTIDRWPDLVEPCEQVIRSVAVTVDRP